MGCRRPAEVEHAHIVDLADKYFGSVRDAGQCYAAVPLATSVAMAARPGCSSRPPRTGREGIGYRDPDYFALATIRPRSAAACHRGCSSASARRGLVYDIRSKHRLCRRRMFGIYAGTGEDDLGERCRQCARNSPALPARWEAELVRARKQIKAARWVALESSGARSEQAARHLIVHDQPIPYAEIVARIGRSTRTPCAASRRLLKGDSGCPGPIDELEPLDKIAAPATLTMGGKRRQGGRHHWRHDGHGVGHRQALRRGGRLRLHHRSPSDVLDAAGDRPQSQASRRRNLADLDRLYEVVKREKGHIDVLYASAGVAAWLPFDAVTEQHFDSVFDVNVRGTLFTVQKALPLLKDGGAVIMTGSVADSKGFAAVSVYSASKAAVRSFARTLTTDLRHRKIRVNVLSPGYIDTAVLAPLSKADLAQVVAATPLDRLGKPEDIAKAALFLASDDSSYVTGVELFVDGGLAQV